jgi:peptidoglycan/LPS O-acetylase OafA/YrhL
MRLFDQKPERLGDVMQRHRGVGPGFDLLRLVLSLSVVVFHSFQLVNGRGWQVGALGPAVSFIVPAFFALSGFLVAGSAVRLHNVRTFLVFRVLRIVPALSVEITLSALVLGPYVTVYSIRAYFSDPEFAAYFGNLVGWIHYHLPGVYLGNPLAGIVNGQLWTIPSELHCYILLAALMLVRVFARPVIMFALLAAGILFETATLFRPAAHAVDVLQSGEMLVLCFLCGNLFYLWRNRIVAHWGLLVVSALAFWSVGSVYPRAGFVIGVPAATYIIVYLGMLRMPRIPLLMAGDYSYGIYLYSFALQQAVIWAFPSCRTWWANLAVSLPLIMAIAVLSWHTIEKPALRLRKWLAPRAILPRPVLEEPAAERAAGGKAAALTVRPSS